MPPLLYLIPSTAPTTVNDNFFGKFKHDYNTFLNLKVFEPEFQ